MEEKAATKINAENTKKLDSISNDRSDELSVKDLFLNLQKSIHYVLSKWKTIIVCSILGCIIGFLYSSYKKPIYTASSTFVLEETGGSGGGGLGQYAGIASMVGLDLGGGGGGIFQGDNLLELYRSRTMLEKTLLSKVNIQGKDQLLIDLYIQVYDLRSKWSKDFKLKNINFIDYSIGKGDRTKDSLINVIASEIRKSILFVGKPDKKLSIIEVDVKSKNEFFALAFNNSIVKNVNDFYVQTKTKKSQDNLNILQHQTDSIRRSLNGAISNVAAALDVNPNANQSRQILRVPSQKRQFDAEANKAILTELVKNLEVSKVSLRKETPLIQLIDEPVMPLEKDAISGKKGIIYGAFLGAGGIIVLLLLRRMFKSIMS